MELVSNTILSFHSFIEHHIFVSAVGNIIHLISSSILNIIVRHLVLKHYNSNSRRVPAGKYTTLTNPSNDQTLKLA